jgi:hypothetical protein
MKLITLVCFALVGLFATADEVIEDDCPSGNGITSICGFLPPEDIDVVPGGKAIIVGGFSLDNENGDIRVLHLADNSIETIYSPDMMGPPPSSSDGALWGDPDCPGPPTGFAAHGIQLVENKHGSYTLLVVNHTSREAIEWLEVKDNGGSFSAEWKGCVIVDPELWINDIAMLPDGGFVASHMMPFEISRSIFDRLPNDRVETGYVVDWHKETGWTKIEGTDGALPNGVQVSADGATIYSNHYFANQVVAIDRASGKRLWTTPVEGGPDNISIGDDGKLYFPTHLVDLRTIREQCLGKDVDYCGLEFAVYSIDPSDGSATQLFRSKGAPFGGSTVAVKAGNSIYLGAFAGTRIGKISLP